MLFLVEAYNKIASTFLLASVGYRPITNEVNRTLIQNSCSLSTSVRFGNPYIRHK
jgi:hypothetical protein